MSENDVCTFTRFNGSLVFGPKLTIDALKEAFREQQSIPQLKETIASLEIRLEALRERPQSVNEQVTEVALHQLWDTLGVNNQTDAVKKLKEYLECCRRWQTRI